MSNIHRFPEALFQGSTTVTSLADGTPLADMTGPSIRQRLGHTPGHGLDNDASIVAGNYQDRSRSNITIMGNRGMQVCRLSISRSLVPADGKGRVHESRVLHEVFGGAWPA